VAKGSKNAGKRDRPDKSAKRPGRGETRTPGRGRPHEPTEPAELPELPAQPGRPAGQRLYDVPFSSPEPRLVNADVGLHNLVARAGHNAAYTIDVTLLDAPDHRLTRSGVLLAHRVLDGRGEWFLTAPDWQPLLPKDHVEPMGDADLPEDLAALVRPLRRRATLGPVAALNCDRREFALRDDAGSTLALLRDDKVTVRRGGLTTARYREVMITPVGRGLGAEQRAFVDRAFRHVGANRVPRFPRLVTRLGAPATGASDIPETETPDGALPLRRFVGAVVGNRLREVVRSDLALRGGDDDALARLRAAAAALRDELDGLAPALEPDWAEDLHDDLGWLVASGTRPEALRSERYLSALERLVSAARSPHLVVEASEPAAQVLAGLLAGELRALREAADRLRVDAPDAAWREVCEAVERVRGLATSTAAVLPDASAAALALLRKPQRPLAAVRLGDAPNPPSVAALTPEEAFAAGRAYEGSRQRERLAREEFVARWARSVRKHAT
jgi:hypothetical protein